MLHTTLATEPLNRPLIYVIYNIYNIFRIVLENFSSKLQDKSRFNVVYRG